MKKVSKKSVLLAAGSALVGGIGVGVVAVGTMAHADSQTVVEQVTDSGASGDSGVSGVSGVAGPVGRPGRQAHLESVLGPLVTDGTITQAQADKVIAAIIAAQPPRGGRPGGRAFELAASTIGITVDVLRSEMGTTKSIADVAKAHSVEVQTVIDALVADATKKIDEAATTGKLTPEQATTAKSTLVDRVTQRVNAVGLVGGRHRGMHRRGGFGQSGTGSSGTQAPNDAASAGQTA